MLWLSSFAVFAQDYIQKTYSIKTDKNIEYGKVEDFAGNMRSLTLDVSYPTNDSVESCGRPLILIVHGGGFVAGSKDNGSIVRMREDFAKRGYVAVAPNYRLGMFQTNRRINCNASSASTPWNCLNMLDTAEWYRAWFRGVQDAHGAIRFVINNRNSYRVDANNVFVAGQSAGAFVALGVGLLDDDSEVETSQSGKLADAPPPNALYENECVKAGGFDTSIASMRLTRPDLGSYLGTLNPPIKDNLYTIRGVGDIYGGIPNDITEVHRSVEPVLYMFHHPNDLIVPFTQNRVYAGYNGCAMQFPFNCGSIINRMFVYGSNGIDILIDSLNARGKSAPKVQFEKTSNTANCAQQIANPSLAGHSVDNFDLRTKNMATLFADAIDSCASSFVAKHDDVNVRLFPNPTDPTTGFSIHTPHGPEQIVVFDLMGRVVPIEMQPTENYVSCTFKHDLIRGTYMVVLDFGSSRVHKRLVVN